MHCVQSISRISSFFSFLKSLTHLKPLEMFSFFRNDNDEVLMLFLAVAVGYHISSLFLLKILSNHFLECLKALRSLTYNLNALGELKSHVSKTDND